jgi:IclR family transcriptional regulator, pca regulon regulatory protein
MATHSVNKTKNRSSANHAANGFDQDFVASLAHGLAVLKAVSEGPGSISLADLAKRVDMKKTSTWRLAHTLVRLGYILQDAKTRQFSPSPRIFSLGCLFFGNVDVHELAVPLIQGLSERLNETVSLALRDGYEVIYSYRIQTNQILNVNLRVGSRVPLYSTALGRALILDMPEEWLTAYLQELRKDLKAREYTANDGRLLRKLLAEESKLGYSLNDGDLVKGLRAIACPVRDRSTNTVASLGVVVPSSRAAVAELRRYHARELLKTAREISHGIGYRGNDS